MTQTAYAEQAALAAGQPLDMRTLAGEGKISCIADGGLKPGTVAFWSNQDQRLVQDPPALTPVLDADGLIASGVSTAATPVTVSGAGFNGALGAGPFPYGAKVTLALNSHADWNETDIRVTGRQALTGRVVTEVYDVPDAGNVTLTGTVEFDRIDSILIAAQGGTNGTLTAGYLLATAASKIAIAGLVMRAEMTEPVSGEMQFEDGDVLEVCRKGGIAMEIDQDMTTASDIFMRVTAAGAELAGSLRADSDSGDAVRLPPEFVITGNADDSDGDYAPVEVSLP